MLNDSIISNRFCQLSLWGANVKPASKDTSCAFIVNQLASTLLQTTSNLTNAVGGTLGGALDGLGLSDVERDSRKSSYNGAKKKDGGLLGLF